MTFDRGLQKLQLTRGSARTTRLTPHASHRCVCTYGILQLLMIDVAAGVISLPSHCLFAISKNRKSNRESQHDHETSTERTAKRNRGSNSPSSFATHALVRHGPPSPTGTSTELNKFIRRWTLDDGPVKGMSRTSVLASPVCYRYAQCAEYGLSVWSAAIERITSSLSAASSC